ncbi:hypothetical protein HDZ31DRAFT_67100 [Schizophyllum fasciatum]
MSYYAPSRAHSHRSRSHSHSYPASPYYDPNNGGYQQYQTPGTPYYPGTQPSVGMPMPQPTVFPAQGYGGVPQTQPTVVYTPSSHRSHRHGRRHSSRHHRHHSEPVVMNVPTATMTPTVITTGSRRSRRSHSHGRHGRHHSSNIQVIQPQYGTQQYYRKDSFSERLKRFFGFGHPPGVKHESKNSSWGFLGHSKRRKYIDLNTGMEVDRRGRPIMRL